MSFRDSQPGLVGIFLRGLLMGAADIVPGVSGGTMAFITGIYGRLVAAIAAFNWPLLQLLRDRQWAAAWYHVDGTFLMALMAGILGSIFSLAHGISMLLERQPALLWSFFFGLICASALLLLRRVERWHPGALLALTGGLLLALAIALSPGLSLDPVPLSFFLGGSLAICAMILPGISGSFILLLLGLYAPLLGALRDFQWLTLALFASGAGCGLLAFSRLLNYLLNTHHAATLATLTGFLVGSLPLLWPWKVEAPGAAQWLTPADYTVRVGEPQVLACAVLGVCGILAVWLIDHRWGGPGR